MFNERIKRIQPIPLLLNMFSPGYSKCGKCGLSWKYCEDKSIPIGKGTFIFATCDYCWDRSSLDELKIYYTKLYNRQVSDSLGLNSNLRYTLRYGLNELLLAVEKEYYSKYTDNELLLIKRKEKIKKIKNRMK